MTKDLVIRTHMGEWLVKAISQAVARTCETLKILSIPRLLPLTEENVARRCLQAYRPKKPNNY